MKYLKDLLADWRKYNKTLIALLGVVLVALNTIFLNNQAVEVVVAVATALGVYQVPNQE